jgi:hypothetical protein
MTKLQSTNNNNNNNNNNVNIWLSFMHNAHVH